MSCYLCTRPTCLGECEPKVVEDKLYSQSENVMRGSNPVNAIHLVMAHAVYEGFPDYEYEDRDWDHYHKTKEDRRIKKIAKHSEYNISVYSMFPQTWGSTSLGFGGIGGQAITSDYVIILQSEVGAGFCVYFGSRFAYRITNPNGRFFKDIADRHMHDVRGASKLYETVT